MAITASYDQTSTSTPVVYTRMYHNVHPRGHVKLAWEFSNMSMSAARASRMLCNHTISGQLYKYRLAYIQP